MGKSKKKKSNLLSEIHPDWVVTEQIQINGRYVSSGTELSILGERGRFVFIKHVQTPTAEWIDVVGGPERHRTYRSFRSDRVKRVHWKNRTRQNSGN
jgi:hypothetical protein